MMKTWKMATVGALVLSLSVVPAYAQLWGNPKVAEKLGLTDEQVDQLGSACVDRQKNAIELGSQMRIAQLELRQLWKADTLDEGKILAKVRELAKLRQEQMVAQAEHRLALTKVLTPEQREKVRKAVAQRRPRAMAGRRGRGSQARGHRPAGRGQGFGPCGPSGPAWGPPARQPGQAPRLGPGRQPGWGRFPAPAPGPGPRQGRSRRQWGALDAGQAPFENDLLALDEEFDTPAFPFPAGLFFEESLDADE